MIMRQKSRTRSRRCLYALISLACVVGLVQFSTNNSWSRAQNRRGKTRADKTVEPNQERPLFPSKSTTGPRSSKASQDPVEEPGEVRTVDISSVGPLSFDGDLRNLTPVPMDLTQREIDFEERLQYPETPLGAPDKSSQQQLAAALTVQAPAPAPIK